jgi:hypothetical protein
MVVRTARPISELSLAASWVRNGLPNGHCTRPPAVVKPLEIVSEAKALGPYKALDVYADKFDLFATLNPSLLRAVEKAVERYGRSPAYSPARSAL